MLHPDREANRVSESVCLNPERPELFWRNINVFSFVSSLNIERWCLWECSLTEHLILSRWCPESRVIKSVTDFKSALSCDGLAPVWPKQRWRRSLTYICVISPQCVNSSTPSVTYMRQWIGSTFVQIMACRLFGSKPLSKPVLGYCQLDS